MYCPNCGKEIKDDSNFCEYCGAKINTEEDIYKDSYYKSSYKKQSGTKKQFSFTASFLKGMTVMFAILIALFGLNFIRNYDVSDIFGLNKYKYQQYMDDPTMIPELSEPETLSGLIDNLKEVQNFLALYLSFSADDTETKQEVFDKYRKELLKLQKFNSSNLLQENADMELVQDEKGFKKLERQFSKILAPVGLMLSADNGFSKYYLKEDPRFTYKKFGKYLSSDMNEYLKLRAKHYNEVMYHDSLAIKPYKLAQRIGDFEQFINTHKGFAYLEEANELLFSYSFIYTFTPDRKNVKFLEKKTFSKSDKKFIKKYPLSQLKQLFSHLANSANGISESQFDSLYPYEYQKDLAQIKPDMSDLADIFTGIRKNIMSQKFNDSYEFIYSSDSDSWSEYSAEKQLKKGDLILAKTLSGYDIYDYKYKKTNQTIRPNEDVKFIIKSSKLIAYLPSHLELRSLEYSCGGFSFKPLSIKNIKKLFPDVLIINIATFTDTSVQIDKPAGAKTYMLISTSGINYEGYQISGNVVMGELANIFTVTSDENTQVNYTTNLDGESYHMYFITQPSAQQTQQVQDQVQQQAQPAQD